ncbi:uncharacterized protein F4812DRAFT_467251 [Daldinia caldariorum]|uniref:uncharacterized protein n=1 Tax=Daldinia caldariorum TaxID=326644 RepID=UPI0020077C02|nr:uncharacterized protein F4812DRAFT_467251 [Daldinia caldariorum]KAI1471046.1 hypothetical protein F4812DRAFT_467251 [Daldinia caldariorum]
MSEHKHKPSPSNEDISNSSEVAIASSSCPAFDPVSYRNASHLRYLHDTLKNENEELFKLVLDCEDRCTSENAEDSQTVSEDWETTVAVVGDRGPRQSVPGCSASKSTADKKKQILSNSMMQAYIAMRGPEMAAEMDPLFEWIQLRHDQADPNTSSQPHDDPKDVSKMLELMDKALLPENMTGDSPRAAIFEFPKPPHHHIVPPATMNLLPHHKVADAVRCRSPVWGDDEDDDEGAVPTGLLSPCTFLEWSRNCKRWPGKEIQDPHNVLAGAQRMRPEGPAPVKDHFPQYLQDMKLQRDYQTGEELSPLYNVPDDPSLIFTPPGLPDRQYAPAKFLTQYDRMAPMEAKNLRDHVYGKAQKSVPPASTHNRFTNTEVNNVVNRITRFDGDGLSGPEVYTMLKDQYQTLAEQRAEGEAFRERISEQSKRIQELEIERDSLRGYFIPLLQQQRAEHRAEQERLAFQALHGQRGVRDDRIREHLGNHMREVQLQLDRSYMQRTESMNKIKANQRRLSQLEQEICEECLLAGTSPRGIFDELNGLIPHPETPAWSAAGGMNYNATYFYPDFNADNVQPTSADARQPEKSMGEHSMGEHAMRDTDSYSGNTLISPAPAPRRETHPSNADPTTRGYFAGRPPSPFSLLRSVPLDAPGALSQYAGAGYRAPFSGFDEYTMMPQSRRHRRHATTQTYCDPAIAEEGKIEANSSAQKSSKERAKSGASHIRGPDRLICFAPPPREPEPIDRSYYDYDL